MSAGRELDSNRERDPPARGEVAATAPIILTSSAELNRRPGWCPSCRRWRDWVRFASAHSELEPERYEVRCSGGCRLICDGREIGGRAHSRYAEPPDAWPVARTIP